tara:strand:+ start:1190 stop:2443 length:1254 start_codon:yes stop_codon:yes gene_type:complete
MVKKIRIKKRKLKKSEVHTLRAYAEANLLKEVNPVYDIPENLTIGKPFKTLSLGQVSSRMSGDDIGKEIDQELLSEIVRVFKERQKSDPVIIDWQHSTSPFQGGSPAPPESGNALGLIIDLDLRDDGLYAVPAYNERGLKVVKDAGGVLWSSPEYLHGEIFTRDGGEKVGDAQLLAITLTPRPAQQSDKIDTITLKENPMVTESELSGMSQEELIELALAKDSMIKSLEAKIEEMTQENEAAITQDSETQLKEEDEKEDDEKKEALKEEEEKEDDEKKENKLSESLPSTQLLSEIQLLREQVQTLRAEKNEAERREAVNTLLREGKISPAEETAAQKAFDLKKNGDDVFWSMFTERPLNSVVPMHQVGHGASGQEITKESINIKIKELSKEKGLTYNQALSEFRTNNKEEFLKAYGV